MLKKIVSLIMLSLSLTATAAEKEFPFGTKGTITVKGLNLQDVLIGRNPRQKHSFSVAANNVEVIVKSRKKATIIFTPTAEKRILTVGDGVTVVIIDPLENQRIDLPIIKRLDPIRDASKLLVIANKILADKRELFKKQAAIKNTKRPSVVLMKRIEKRQKSRLLKIEAEQSAQEAVTPQAQAGPTTFAELWEARKTDPHIFTRRGIAYRNRIRAAAALAAQQQLLATQQPEDVITTQPSATAVPFDDYDTSEIEVAPPLPQQRPSIGDLKDSKNPCAKSCTIS